MSGAVSNIRLGYFGKYPGYRDFVQRGLPAPFIDRWRSWIATVMDKGSNQLGDRWLDVYLTSPVWRFAIRDSSLSEGICLGALMPSMDARHRYFPLCVVVRLPSEPLFQLLSRAEPFLTALEEAMIATLQEPYADTGEVAKHFDVLWESSVSGCLHETNKTETTPTREGQALQEFDRFIAGTDESIGIWHAVNVASGNECLKVLPSLPDPAMFVKMQQATVAIDQRPECKINLDNAEEQFTTKPSWEPTADQR